MAIMLPIINEETTLTLLVDYCKKTIATVGGDGYEEIVLYYNNEKKSYELHTFQKYVFMKDEEHHIFTSNQDDYDSIMNIISEQKLVDYENVKGFSLCGGDYICKFKSGDKMIRITTANASCNDIIPVGNFMRSLIKEQNEILN